MSRFNALVLLLLWAIPLQAATVTVAVAANVKAAFDDPDSEIPWSTKKRYDDFDYGYALTVHKAQGSQWDNVVLFDESWAFKETRQRWLYTAITRAAKSLTVVR